MTIYNKTTKTQSFGSGKFCFSLPASDVSGERGAGVEIDSPRKFALQSEWRRVESLRRLGAIEIDGEV